MKKLLLALALCSTIPALAAPSPAATQAWVNNAVSNSVAQLAATAKTTVTGGVVTVEMEGGRTLSMELFTDAALYVTNATALANVQGVTNGAYFVWNGAGRYILPPLYVEATPTNLVFNGEGSVEVGGLAHFEGIFDLASSYIPRSLSYQITNKVEEVAQ